MLNATGYSVYVSVKSKFELVISLLLSMIPDGGIYHMSPSSRYKVLTPTPSPPLDLESLQLSSITSIFSTYFSIASSLLMPPNLLQASLSIDWKDKRCYTARNAWRVLNHIHNPGAPNGTNPLCAIMGVKTNKSRTSWVLAAMCSDIKALHFQSSTPSEYLDEDQGLNHKPSRWCPTTTTTPEYHIKSSYGTWAPVPPHTAPHPFNLSQHPVFFPLCMLLIFKLDSESTAVILLKKKNR